MMNDFKERKSGTEYDDLMAMPVEFRKQLQEFNLSLKKYEDRPQGLTFPTRECGGLPLDCDGIDEHRTIYVDSQDSHTLVLGATGSKKSRLVVMPGVKLLGAAGESMIITDPKAEIYNRTAYELEQIGYRVVVVNFRNPTLGNSWNPLYLPYVFYKKNEIDRTCELVNDIALNLMVNQKSVSDPFWNDSAGDLFFGLVLTLFKMCAENDLPEEYVDISNVLRLRSQLFDGVGSPSMSPIWKYVRDDEIIAPALNAVIPTAQDTRAGILSTFDQKVRYFMYQPNLMDMLANNTVDISNIAEEKTAFYLIMPDEKTTFHPLISLFIKQSYEYLIYQAQNNPGNKMKIRLNYILDEFSSLPTIKDFPAMITASRSRNIRFCLVVQSKHQLSQRYGEETETIQSNCNNWIFLTSRELQLLQELSSLCGNVRDGRLPLVSISALQHLDKNKGEALVLCGRKNPYYARLWDIDQYDNGRYKQRPILPEARNQREKIDGRSIALKYLSKEEFPVFQEGKDIMSSVNRNETDMKLDDIIKQIDLKIKELEDQEESDTKSEDADEV